MRIHIVRHGEAEPASQEVSDGERKLTAEGRRQSQLLGSALSVLDNIPTLILTSPLRRALETTEIAVRAMTTTNRRPPIRVLDRLSPEFRTDDLLSALPIESTSLMLIGHQPTLGELAGILIGGIHARPLPLSTGSVACLETIQTPSPGVAHLEYFLRQNIISFLARIP